MIITKRKPVTVGEMLIEEFMEPLNVTQVQLAKAMGVSRRTVNEICTNKRSVTVDTALMLAKVFGNIPDFWLNVQRSDDNKMKRICSARFRFERRLVGARLARQQCGGGFECA